MTGQPLSEPPPPAHPPTAPPAVWAAPPASGSKWAMGLGIVVIVIGALGAVGNCGGIASPLFMDMSAGMLPSGEVSVIRTMQQYQTPTVLLSILLTALGIMLLVAGIGIMKRRRWAVRMSLWYAALKIVATLLNAAMAYVIQQAMFDAMQNQTQAMAPLGTGFTDAMGLFSVIFTVILGWAMPVFLLIWFGRAKMRAEVADWS